MLSVVSDAGLSLAPCRRIKIAFGELKNEVSRLIENNLRARILGEGCVN